VWHRPAYVVARLEKGEAVDPATYHFRIAPLFETGAIRVDHHVVAIGVGHRRAYGPLYSIFEVL